VTTFYTVSRAHLRRATLRQPSPVEEEKEEGGTGEETGDAETSRPTGNAESDGRWHTHGHDRVCVLQWHG